MEILAMPEAAALATLRAATAGADDGELFLERRRGETILLDEKIGGTVHMAIGAGYPDTGSVNRSAIHWDLICDLRRGGRVTVDGQDFLVDGRFVPWGD